MNNCLNRMLKNNNYHQIAYQTFLFRHLMYSPSKGLTDLLNFTRSIYFCVITTLEMETFTYIFPTWIICFFLLKSKVWPANGFDRKYFIIFSSAFGEWDWEFLRQSYKRNIVKKKELICPFLVVRCLNFELNNSSIYRPRSIRNI